MSKRDFPSLKAWSVAKRTLGLDGAGKVLITRGGVARSAQHAV
jgi:hypothetical protein